MPAELRLEFHQVFLDELLAVERFLGRFQPSRGRDFTRAVFDFAYSVVATVPEGFPRYAHPLSPELPLRRAVFRRKYALLYRLEGAELTFLYFYPTRRDISSVALSV